MDDDDPVSVFMILDHWQEAPIDADDFPYSSQDSQTPSSSSTETYMVGFVIANIVGLQYYSGTISGREMVGLVREPLNPYDSNAIKVLNTRTVQVGHVERTVSAVLAPLVDDNMIAIEGIVPSTPATRKRFKLPCQIHIFARREAFSTVKSAISRGGLQLISDSDPSFALSEAAVLRETRSGCDKRFKSVDEIFKLVDENVSKKGASEAFEPPKEVIKSELFVHQKEALGWLVHRENSTELPPFWEEKDGFFVNVLTNYRTIKRPEPLRSGIFADDMGLGKTLTLLSLIALDKYGTALHHSSTSNGSVDANKLELDDNDMGEQNEGLYLYGGKKAKRGNTGKKVMGSRKKRKSEDACLNKDVEQKPVSVVDNSTDFGTKMTLVVCPPCVFSSWVLQLSEHTKPGRLKVYMYHGDRTNDPEELKKYDIVLTTYSTLATETTSEDSPIKQIEWWRVILDEAHVIKNVNSLQSRAVTDLNANRRWVVTGTPIQNGSFDLFSLMSFLRFEPFSIKSYWQSLVQRPLAVGRQQGLSRLQVVSCHTILFFGN